MMTGESCGVEVPSGSLHAGPQDDSPGVVAAVHGLAGTQMGFGALAGSAGHGAGRGGAGSARPGDAADPSPARPRLWSPMAMAPGPGESATARGG